MPQDITFPKSSNRVEERDMCLHRRLNERQLQEVQPCFNHCDFCEVPHTKISKLTEWRDEDVNETDGGKSLTKRLGLEVQEVYHCYWKEYQLRSPPKSLMVLKAIRQLREVICSGLPPKSLSADHLWILYVAGNLGLKRHLCWKPLGIKFLCWDYS